MLEIERKFLVSEWPESYGRGHNIIQSYLSFNPEIRLRWDDGERTFTVKLGSGLTREEFTARLGAAEYNRLACYAKGQLTKTRFPVKLPDFLMAELDRYSGVLEGLQTVEVEFIDEKEAKSFSPPAWFGAEVTGQEFFSNANLAKLASLGEKEEV